MNHQNDSENPAVKESLTAQLCFYREKCKRQKKELENLHIQLQACKDRLGEWHSTNQGLELKLKLDVANDTVRVLRSIAENPGGFPKLFPSAGSDALFVESKLKEMFAENKSLSDKLQRIQDKANSVIEKLIDAL